MRSIRRNLTRESLLVKTQLNRSVPLQTRFNTLWTSEIHINLKTDADALNQRRRRYDVSRRIYPICQGQWRQYAGKCACVYSICNL